MQSAGNQNISIHTFGKSQENLEKVKGTDGININVNCYVKDISTPIACQNINYAKENYHHIRLLNLADKNHKNSALPIYILIGADYYWSIVSNEIIRGSSGPIALKSKVGYILSGPISNNHVYNHKNSVLLSNVLAVQSELIETLRKEDGTEENVRFYKLRMRICGENPHFERSRFELDVKEAGLASC